MRDMKTHPPRQLGTNHSRMEGVGCHMGRQPPGQLVSEQNVSQFGLAVRTPGTVLLAILQVLKVDFAGKIVGCRRDSDNPCRPANIPQSPASHKRVWCSFVIQIGAKLFGAHPKAPTHCQRYSP